MKKPQIIIKVMEGDELELFENLSFEQQEIWSSWMAYLFSRCKPVGTPSRDDYGYLIPMVWVRRWERQINASYKEMSEEEKESDRDQVRKFWPLIEPLLK